MQTNIAVNNEARNYVTRKPGVVSNSTSHVEATTNVTDLKLNNNNNNNSNYRLPHNLKPFYYDLLVVTKFHGDIEPFDFNGVVKIFFKCFEETNKLILHSKHIEVEQIIIINDFNNSMKINKYTYDLDREFLIIELEEKKFEFQRNYVVIIKYKGYLIDDSGFYRSSYNDIHGNKRWLMTSQMQPTDARKAFPCFDEPAMKAKFKISAIYHKDYFAISNMPVAATRTYANDTNFRETVFEESIPMSTYLVALIISDFKCKYGVAKAGPTGKVNVSVCGRPSAYNQFDYALGLAIKAIENYEKYFGIEYTLKKCDNVGLPDFMIGAMENWGLITYREINLFYDEKNTPNHIKHLVNIMILHEVAHMWFGNLVSPDWWSDLWLSEGFATYMEYKNLPFETIDSFRIMYHLFQLDSVTTSHPILVDTQKPIEIAESFDDITYAKSSIVIRMMNYFLGEETFNRGIRRYLNKYKYSNAKQEHLWESLQEQMDLEETNFIPNIEKIMVTWTKQMGHPVINVKILNETTISITQKHFLLDPSTNVTELGVHNSTNYKWYVPFTYTIEQIGLVDNKNISRPNISDMYSQMVWLLPEDEKSNLYSATLFFTFIWIDSICPRYIEIITLSQPFRQETYILANLDMSGFYRVNYDLSNWNKIIKQLKIDKNAINVISRTQLINDIFGFAQSGLQEVTKPFELINYLIHETEYLPWSVAIDRLRFVSDMLESTDFYPKFQEHIIKIVKPIYNRLSWKEHKDESQSDRSLRALILNYACELGLEDCVTTSKNMLSSWIQSQDKNVIPPNFRAFVCCTAIRYGGLKEWEFLSTQYDQEEDPSVKENLQVAMSCVKEPWLIKRFLQDQLNETKVRRQDSVYGIISAARSAYASLITWNFVKEYWSELFQRFGHTMFFSNMVSEVGIKFNNEYQLNDVKTFFAQTTNHGAASREVTVTIEKIKTNIKWLKNNFKKLKEWFK